MKYNKASYVLILHGVHETITQKSANSISIAGFYHRSLIRLYITSLIWLCACDFGETNIDPTTLPDVEVNLILPVAQAQTARNLTSVGTRVTGAVVQHFKGIEAQPESYSSYLIDENTLDQYWRTGLYAAALRDCHLIIEKSGTTSPHYAGIAKVLMAINLGIATSFWGDVPFEQAFLVDNEKPKFDDQRQIYEQIQWILDQAIDDLSAPVGKLVPGQDDLIFGGDAPGWSRTARALKARFYLHLSKRDKQAASKALMALAEGSEINLETTPSFPFADNQNEANAFARFGEDRPNQLSLGDFIHSILVGQRDPRLSKYGVFSNGEYLLYQKGNTDLYWGQLDAHLPLISLTEVLFIKAECHLRTGNAWEAYQLYLDAITSSMEFLEVSETETETYMSTIQPWDGLSTFDEKLKLIIEQKYIALFVQGSIETWVDYRRTGYPELTPPSNANESFNPGKVVPRRYLYPISERNANQVNTENAIKSQGGHLLDVDLWAFR